MASALPAPFTTRRDSHHSPRVTASAGDTLRITLVRFHSGLRAAIIRAMPANYRFLVDLSARILAQGGASGHIPRHNGIRRAIQPENYPYLVHSVPIPAQNPRTPPQIHAAAPRSPIPPNPAPRLASRSLWRLVS